MDAVANKTWKHVFVCYFLHSGLVSNAVEVVRHVKARKKYDAFCLPKKYEAFLFLFGIL